MNATELQEVVFAHLMNPDTHGGVRVERIDTHAASVFLAGDHAYKVKRAVSYPYLDYSTLEKRKAACEKELEINRRFAPGLYLKVTPITREPNDKLALGGGGKPIEWAVVMKRFDEWGLTHAGLFTFGHSPKHVAFYQTLGFWPRYLTAVMEGPVSARAPGATFQSIASARDEATWPRARAAGT